MFHQQDPTRLTAVTDFTDKHSRLRRMENGLSKERACKNQLSAQLREEFSCRLITFIRINNWISEGILFCLKIQQCETKQKPQWSNSSPLSWTDTTLAVRLEGFEKCIKHLECRILVESFWHKLLFNWYGEPGQFGWMNWMYMKSWKTILPRKLLNLKTCSWVNPARDKSKRS